MNRAYTDLPAVAQFAQISSIWKTMQGWNDYDSLTVTETFWHQGMSKVPFEYRIGRLKNTSVWNGGKYVDANSRIVGAQYLSTPAWDTPGAGWSMSVV